MRIGFCYNVLHDARGGLNNQRDFDPPETIAAIREVIESLGHTVLGIEADEKVFDKLAKEKNKIDLVFNIAEGLHGDARESWVPMACEILKIPYTHSGPTVQALKLDKTLAKLAVAGLGMRVPKSIVISNGEVGDTGQLHFPAIIKPNGEGSSIGVFDANVVEDEKQLTKRVKELRKQGLTGKLIAEEYIDGREFTVGMLGNGDGVQVFPAIEQNFEVLPAGMKPIAGYELKWLVEDQLKDVSQAYFCPAKLTPKEQREIEELSRKVYVGLGVRDCARIDYRMDRAGKLFFLELNTLPGIIPDPTVICYFVLGARKAGLTYPQLLQKIIYLACERYNISR